MTLPLAPLSLPAITSTVSPFLTFMRSPRCARLSQSCCFSSFARCARSQDLRREGDDLHEPLVAELATDRPEDACPPRLAVRLDQHGRVLVEPDVGPVRPALLLDGTHDDR